MADTDVPTVSADQVGDLISQGWTLIDVRSDEEWAEGRIPGSQHLPMDQLVEKVGSLGNQLILVCAVGGRSWRATQYLTNQGVDAVNLDGGLQGWAAAGRDVEH